MKVQFNLQVQTAFGQNVFLVGNCKELENNDLSKAIPLSYTNNNHWTCELDITTNDFDYYYLIKQQENIEKEWQTRNLKLNNINKKIVVLQDFWYYAALPENNFSTQFFYNLSGYSKDRALTYKGKNLVFKIKANLFNKDLSVCILGSCKELNHWGTNQPVLLKQIDFNTWEVPLKFKKPLQKVAYKYGIYNNKTKKFIRFEQGNDRFVYPQTVDVFRVIHDNNLINLPNNNWRGTGLAVPVFSLRSNNSFGVGEFADLKLLADWCQQTGMKMIQILPINDTTATHTWTDSYPYASISIYALHPQYINLEAIDLPKPKQFNTEYQALKTSLNKNQFVDYEVVNKEKKKFLQNIFELNLTKIRRSVLFKKFIKENEEWLKPYATFCVLRDKYGTADFSKWEKNKKYTKKLIEKTFAKNAKTEKEALFNCFVQWQLHLQLLDASDYIHSKNITLKGDIPIGIYRHSTDSWVGEKLYHRNQQAGAPPDDFSVLGQNWEFPTYNWQEMKKDGYQWWKSRFTHMSQYFDAFRIDHILGFFRIWQIPQGSTQGILGYFHPAISISTQELYEKGLWYDEDRLTKPYINHHILWEFFGDDKDAVFTEYFTENNGNIQFKPKYDSQQKIEQALNNKLLLKNALLALHANVLFINEGDSQNPALHPRYALFQTKSYEHLDDDSKWKLKQLHDDYFYRRNEQFWKENALEKLPELKQSTNMLVCGEDLGMVPSVVPEVMNQLSILALKVQRMPSGKERFSHPAHAPYLSVVSPSSHDTSTLSQWWEESRDNTQFYYNHVIAKDGAAPMPITTEVLHAIIDQHLWSPAMLCVIPIQEFFALDDKIKNPDIHSERINQPDVFPHYWRYRMHLALEDLLQENNFNQMLKDKMTKSGRG